MVGHDRDAEAIARAQAMTHAADLGGRVSFVVSDSERLPRNAYDLITVATLSDRRQALEVLNAIRNAILPDGVCVLLEPPVSVVLGGSSGGAQRIVCARSPSVRVSPRSASSVEAATTLRAAAMSQPVTSTREESVMSIVARFCFDVPFGKKGELTSS